MAQSEQASELLEAGLGHIDRSYISHSHVLQLAEVDILSAKNSISDNRQALHEIIGEAGRCI